MVKVAFMGGLIGAAVMSHAAEQRISDGVLHRTLSVCAAVMGQTMGTADTGLEEPICASFGHTVATAVEVRVSGVTMKVEPTSGRILYLDALRSGLGDGQTTAPRTVLDEDRAEAAAREHLSQLGCVLGSSAKPVLKRLLGRPGVESRWEFGWEREIDGYAFPEEDVVIVLAADGRLRFFRDYRTVSSCPTAPIIAESGARLTAEAWGRDLIKRGLGDYYDVSAVPTGQLKVAYSNCQYVNGNGPSFVSSKRGVRLVYWYEVRFRYVGPAVDFIAPPLATLWVDAITGERVGGL